MTSPSHASDSQADELATREFQRVLIVKPSSVGDIVHALPVLRILRRRYPHSRIDWLVNSPFADLIAGHSDLDRAIAFDRRRYALIGRRWNPTRAFHRFARELRRVRYDLVIDLQGLFRSGWLAWVTGAAVRVGFRNARELAWLFYTHRVTVPMELHAVDRNLRLVSCLGGETDTGRIDMQLTDDERVDAGRLLSGAGLSDERPFVAILPGARWETKRWMPDRFAELVDRIDQHHGCRCVLLGSPDEATLCDQIVKSTRTSPIDLAGRTTLRQLVGILDRAALVVTHDSAPMHVADALGKPLVALLGPTNRNRTGPYHQRGAVMQADLPCVPCHLKHLAQCPYDHACMQSIAVDDVYQRVSAHIAEFENRPSVSLPIHSQP